MGWLKVVYQSGTRVKSCMCVLLIDTRLSVVAVVAAEILISTTVT